MGAYALNQSTMLEVALRTLLAHDELRQQSSEWLSQWQHTEGGYLPPFIWKRALAKVEQYRPLQPLYARPPMPKRGNGRPALETEGVALMLLRRKLEGLPLGMSAHFGQFTVRRMLTEGGTRWRVFVGEKPTKCDRELVMLDAMLKLLEVRA